MLAVASWNNPSYMYYDFERSVLHINTIYVPRASLSSSWVRTMESPSCSLQNLEATLY